MGNIFSNAMHQLNTTAAGRWTAGEYSEVRGPWTTGDQYVGVAVADDSHPALAERLAGETDPTDWLALRAELRRLGESGQRALVISREVITAGEDFGDDGAQSYTSETFTEIVYDATPLRAAGVIDYYGWTTALADHWTLGVDHRAGTHYVSDSRSTDDYSVNQSETFSYRLVNFSVLQRRAVSGFLVAGLRMRGMHVPASLQVEAGETAGA